MRGFRFGQIVLDVDRRQALKDDRALPITPKNFDLLRELAAAEGRLVTREALGKAVWPATEVEEATLRQNIYSLRNLLREADPEHEYLETVPKAGYRLAVPVEVLEEEPVVAEPAPRNRPPLITRSRLLIAALAGLLVITVAALARHSTNETAANDVRAKELLRQGWMLLDQRDGERFPAVAALFDDVLSLDPKSAAAHSGKAVLFTLENNELEALREAERVAELDPTSGIPFAVRGFLEVYRWNWQKAGEQLTVASQRACPDPACRQWYAHYLGLTGQLPLAIRESAYAVELNPTRLAPRAELGQMFWWSGQTEAAIRELKIVVDTGGNATHARWHLWKAELAAGDTRSASEALLLAVEPAWYRLPADDPFRMLTSRRDAFGTPSFFRQVAEAGQKIRMNDYFSAEVWMAAGDRQTALAHLERALAAHLFFVPYAKRDPLFAPLHGDARYEAVMKAVGL